MRSLSQFSVLKTLITRFVQASIADSEKGGGDPSSYAEIEFELARSKFLLDAQIDRIKKAFKHESIT